MIDNNSFIKLLPLFKKFRIDLLSNKIKNIDLFKTGILDSYSYFELINEIEKKLKIKFSDKEIFNKNNGNLEYLLKLISKKTKC